MLANKTLLQMKYARVIRQFADEAHIGYEEAMDKFYNSNTYTLMSEGIADMHCRSDGYLADELIAEYFVLQNPGYTDSCFAQGKVTPGRASS